ncbi:hypothetical protein [Aurantivibrio infirmus]
MTYEEIVKEAESLSYRDKLRLAQLLIQLGRKEEEEQYPTERKVMEAKDSETIQYVAERITKSKPSKKATLSNFIGAMFQFQGGISDEDINHIIAQLHKRKLISITENGKIIYQV